MVNIEGILKLVGTPRLGISGSKKFQIDVAKEAGNSERAEHNIERMKGLQGRVLELIKKRCRFDAFTMDSDSMEKELYIENEKIANVKGDCRYKKTPYKNVVEGMENYLQGIAFHVNRGRYITFL